MRATATAPLSWVMFSVTRPLCQPAGLAAGLIMVDNVGTAVSITKVRTTGSKPGLTADTL